MEEEILKEIKKNRLISIIELVIFIILTIFQINYLYPQDNYSDYPVGFPGHLVEVNAITAFNNQFISFEGYQTGANVKVLIGRLISNANTYRDEPAKVPQFYINQLSNTNRNNNEVTFEMDDAGNPQNYMEELITIRNKIESKHEYYVEMTYQNDGYIDYIIISYDSNNIAPAKYRENIVD